jgi:hypothetical protein
MNRLNTIAVVYYSLAIALPLCIACFTVYFMCSTTRVDINIIRVTINWNILSDLHRNIRGKRGLWLCRVSSVVLILMSFEMAVIWMSQTTLTKEPERCGRRDRKDTWGRKRGCGRSLGFRSLRACPLVTNVIAEMVWWVQILGAVAVICSTVVEAWARSITYELLGLVFERSSNIVSLFKELENIRINAWFLSRKDRVKLKIQEGSLAYCGPKRIGVLV